MTRVWNSSKWQAYITFEKKRQYLGCRNTAREAFFELYVPAALKYFGEFARLEYKENGTVRRLVKQ